MLRRTAEHLKTRRSRSESSRDDRWSRHWPASTLRIPNPFGLFCDIRVMLEAVSLTDIIRRPLMDALRASGGIGRRARLRAWWGVNPVEVRVLSCAILTHQNAELHSESSTLSFLCAVQANAIHCVRADPPLILRTVSATYSGQCSAGRTARPDVTDPGAYPVMGAACRDGRSRFVSVLQVPRCPGMCS